MSLGMRPPQESIRRPTGPSNLAQSLFGAGSIMPMLGAPMQQQQSATPQPTAGRIPVSGMPAGNLASLFAEADKMAKQPQGGTMVNGQFQPDQATQDLYADWKKYNNIYSSGNSYGITDPEWYKFGGYTKQQQADRARQKQMDLMSLAGKSQSEVLTAMGVSNAGSSSNGNAAASLAAQKEAEAFLKSLGLG